MNVEQTYIPDPGESIQTTAQKITTMAQISGENVTANFNDIQLLAKPGDSWVAIVRYFQDECERRRIAHETSPEYAEMRRQMREGEKRREHLLEGALFSAPAKPTWKDQSAWDSFVANNPDDYGAAVCRYAELWARLMESRINHGDTLEGCADESSHIADTEGMTGFMYGCAVSMLAACWKHGEELRKWHNLKTQIRDEGEKANATPGAVLNPALLRIG